MGSKRIQKRGFWLLTPFYPILAYCTLFSTMFRVSARNVGTCCVQAGSNAIDTNQWLKGLQKRSKGQNCLTIHNGSKWTRFGSIMTPVVTPVGPILTAFGRILTFWLHFHPFGTFLSPFWHILTHIDAISTHWGYFNPTGTHFDPWIKEKAKQIWPKRPLGTPMWMLRMDSKRCSLIFLKPLASSQRVTRQSTSSKSSTGRHSNPGRRAGGGVPL